MTVNVPVPSYVFRSTGSDAFAELDEVRLLTGARTKHGDPVPVGAQGTVLSVWADGAAYMVEFEHGIATVEAEHLAPAE